MLISYFSIYSLSLSFNGVEKRITYYHFKDWPDHSGSDSKKVLKLLKTCLPIYKLGQDRILVHCSAGVGRTGTFITLLSILHCIDGFGNINDSLGESEESLVSRIVSRLRLQRIFSVQSLEQFIFIYRVLLESLNE